MAYTTGTLSYLAGGPLEGAWKLWEYTSTDSLAVVTGSGYITDATAKGMSIGDFVIVANQTNPQGYILQVQSIRRHPATRPAPRRLPCRRGSGDRCSRLRATSSMVATSR